MAGGFKWRSLPEYVKGSGAAREGFIEIPTARANRGGSVQAIPDRPTQGGGGHAAARADQREQRLDRGEVGDKAVRQKLGTWKGDADAATIRNALGKEFDEAGKKRVAQ
jgi:hypothetical protein